MDEQQLIQQLQVSFSDEDFELLLSGHLQYGFAIIYRLTLNQADSEDILQNALLKVMRGLPAFKLQASFRTWFAKICYHEGISFLQRNKKHASIDLEKIEAVLPSADNIELEVVEIMEKEKVWKAVDELRPQYRLVLLLFYQDELKIKEIAEQLEITEQSVKVLLHRARIQLKERMISL